MVQKVLKVGSSAAVTIPKKSLSELGINIGDQVSVSVYKSRRMMIIEPASTSFSIDNDLVQWTKQFIERYRPALEALARK